MRNFAPPFAVGDDRAAVVQRSISSNHRSHRSGGVFPPPWQPPFDAFVATMSAGRLAAGAALLALLTLAGCGAPAPKDYGGSWTSVNRFQNAPTEIPLSPVYTFYASPMDATLRTMLKRWTADNGLQLSYQLGSDFTLYQPVAQIRTNDIQAAVSELSTIYAQQGVSVTADGKRILVQSSGTPQVTSGLR